MHLNLVLDRRTRTTTMKMSQHFTWWIQLAFRSLRTSADAPGANVDVEPGAHVPQAV